jgi:hypothetical protein
MHVVSTAITILPAGVLGRSDQVASPAEGNAAALGERLGALAHQKSVRAMQHRPSQYDRILDAFNSRDRTHLQ